MDWRYTSSTTGPTIVPETPNSGAAPVDYYLPFKQMADAAEHLAKMMASLVPLGLSSVARH